MTEWQKFKEEVLTFMKDNSLSYRRMADELGTSAQNLHGRLKKNDSPDLDLVKSFRDTADRVQCGHEVVVVSDLSELDDLE